MNRLVIVAISLLMFAGGFSRSQNLIVNADFAPDAKGAFPPWKLIEGKITRGKDYVQVSPVDKVKGGLLFQHVQLRPDEDYQLEYEVRSPNGAKATVYVEAVYPQPKGEPVFHSQCVRKPLTDVWRHDTKTIRFAKGWKSIYVGIRTRGDGIAQVRKLRLIPAPPTVKTKGLWQVFPPHQRKNGVLTIRGESGKAAVWEHVPVIPGKQYQLDYTAEGQGTVSSSSNNGMHQFGVVITPAVENSVQSMDLLENVKQNKFLRFRVPANGDIKKVNFTFKMFTNGTVQFSKFALREVPVDLTTDWRIKLLSPSYRGTFYGPDNHPIIGQVIASKPAERAELVIETSTDWAFQPADNEKLKAPGRVKTLLKQTINLTDGQGQFTFPMELDYGKFRLKTRFLDHDGKCLARRETVILKVPDRPDKVVIEDQRHFKIGTKNFFPLKLHVWSKRYNEEQMAFLAGNGVNTFLSAPHPAWNKKLRASLLDQAHRHGIKLMLVLHGVPRSMNEVAHFMEDFKKDYSPEIRKHPALLAYCLDDEPLWNGRAAEPLQAAYQFLREIDPYHPVYINAAPRYSVESHRPYAAACDIYGVDIYPIPYPNSHSELENKSPSCVGEYTRRYREVVRDEKPIITILQGCAWHECTNRNVPPKPYPTATELRFMALDCLTNGAMGYSIWGPVYIRNPEFFLTLMESCREIHAVSELFNQGRQLPDLPSANPKVRIAVYECQGRTYYVALNVSAQPQSVQLELTSPKVMFYLDRKEQTLQKGKLSLSLPLYSATVFGDAPLPKPEKNLKSWKEGYNPFEKDCLDRLTAFLSKPYAGKAKWIWDKKKLYAGASCRLAKRFTITKVTPKAYLALAVDDEATVYVNGTNIGKFTSWNIMTRMNVAKFLKTGENVLVVDARDSKLLPCAVLAELSCGNSGFVSDQDWKALPPDKTIQDALKEYDSSPATHVIGPYGTNPWGNHIKVITKD